jgi:GNAT superfamily N-acetyltransferase
MFQHFTFPEVLRKQIARTPSNMLEGHSLGQLAQQFGQASGVNLRDAIGGYKMDGTWEPHLPDPSLYANELDSHIRAGILVAAIFDAFLNIYRQRIRLIPRIAMGGVALSEAELHPDLVTQLTETAAKTAQIVLRICIRALDYCPPIDITFGDYLRAIITADCDMVADDSCGYRVAFSEAFQKHGIGAADVKSMAIEELAYELYPDKLSLALQERVGEFLRNVMNRVRYLDDRSAIYEETKNLILGKEGLHGFITRKLISQEFEDLTGLMFPGNRGDTEKKGLEYAFLTSRTAAFAVGNLWLANRITPDRRIVNHAIVTLIQKRGVRFKVEGTDVQVDENAFFVPDKTPIEDRGEHIVFRGGCTLVFDLDSLQLRYAIKKNIDDCERMVLQYKHESGMLKCGARVSNVAPQTGTTVERVFDIFLSHNSKDKPAVRVLTKLLQERGFRPWLDELHLTPGEPWKRELVQAVDACHSIGVLVGKSGLGPWALEETRIALDEAVRVNKPLIPIILPGAELNENELPPEWRMITQRTGVSFANGFHRDAVTRLCQGIEKAMRHP